MIETDEKVELYEAVWREWLKQNKARDKYRFRRRLRRLFFVVASLTVVALLWTFTVSAQRS
jgi:hypothetical protein